MTHKDPEAPYPHRHQMADMLHYHGCDARLYEIGYAAREDEVSELKARIAGLEGRIQGMLESREKVLPMCHRCAEVKCECPSFPK